tara:strand:- start:14951 stop:15310 length:360 start_codon:yes stop_codon:yes gene_type:complete
MDGEGCIQLTKATSKNGNVYFKPRVSITGCYYPTLKYLQKVTKCCLGSKGKTGGRPCYVAVFNGKKALQFIKVLLPFLKEKRNQAITLLDWEKYPVKSSQHEKIYRKLQSLKKVYYGPS